MPAINQNNEDSPPVVGNADEGMGVGVLVDPSNEVGTAVPPESKGVTVASGTSVAETAVDEGALVDVAEGTLV